MKRFITPAIILLLFICAIYLRTYGLKTQGLILYDEGTMVTRAAELKDFIVDPHHPKPVETRYVDTKMLWLVFIAISQLLWGNTIIAAQYASVFFGLLTIGMTYLLALRFYKNQTIAVLSTLFICFSPLHIFYSRAALAESASTFFALFSIYLCFQAGNHGTYKMASSGVMWTLSFLANRFRVILFPLFVFIFEIYKSTTSGTPLRAAMRQFGIFLAASIGVLTVYMILIQVANSFGFSFGAYLPALQEDIIWHAEWIFEPASLITYLYYLLKFEGIGVLVLFLISLFFSRRPHPTIPFLLFVFIQIFLSSINDEKVIRAMSVVLPFLSIVCAVTLYHLLNLVKESRLRLLYLFCIILILGSGFLNSIHILSFKTDMPRAVRWIIEEQGYKGGILSTNKSITKAYAPDNRIAQLDARIKGYYDQGYDYMIIEPGKFILGNYTGFWKRDTNANLYPAIEEYCRPLRVYDNFNDSLLDAYLFEHTRPSFLKMYNFRKSLPPNSGQLVIYDVGDCLEAIKIVEEK